jgi:hypothetical protein
VETKGKALNAKMYKPMHEEQGNVGIPMQNL